MPHALHRRVLVAALCAIAAAAALFAFRHPAAGAAPDPGAALDEVYARIDAAHRSRDAAGIAAQYTEDALYLSDASDIQRGRAGIESGFANYFRRVAELRSQPEMSHKVVERRVEGDLAYDVGYYRLESKMADGKVEVAEWKYCTVFARGKDGVWRIRVDSMGPAPAGAMAGRG